MMQMKYSNTVQRVIVKSKFALLHTKYDAKDNHNQHYR